MLTLCLDIGGTKIAAGLADPAGTLVHTAQRPTPAYGGAEQVWAAVAEMIADALGVAGGAVGGVGIASAGPIDLHSGRVSPINIGSWGGFPLRDRVAAAVPGVPVRLGGDGVCMALGEHWLGAGRGARFLLGLVVSTGVGGGLVLDGAPCLGRTGNAGHVGHVVVDPDGSPCPCGGRGWCGDHRVRPVAGALGAGGAFNTAADAIDYLRSRLTGIAGEGNKEIDDVLASKKPLPEQLAEIQAIQARCNTGVAWCKRETGVQRYHLRRDRASTLAHTTHT